MCTSLTDQWNNALEQRHVPLEETINLFVLLGTEDELDEDIEKYVHDNSKLHGII